MSSITILITGAGHGIGRALAIAYARQARDENTACRLLLCARTAGGLAETEERCRALGAFVDSRAFDLCDQAALAVWIAHIRATAIPDILILNAGIASGYTHPSGIETAQGMHAEMMTNVLPVMAIVDGLLPVLQHRKGGARIALMSSIAALLPLPGWAGYCASKAALRVYGHAMRPALATAGIGMTVIVPGFVDTGLSARIGGRKPLMTDTDAMATRIMNAIRHNKAEYIYPRLLALLARLGWCLPVRLRDRVLMKRFRYPLQSDGTPDP